MAMAPPRLVPSTTMGRLIYTAPKGCTAFTAGSQGLIWMSRVREGGTIYCFSKETRKIGSTKQTAETRKGIDLQMSFQISTWGFCLIERFGLASGLRRMWIVPARSRGTINSAACTLQLLSMHLGARRLCWKSNIGCVHCNLVIGGTGCMTTLA